MSLFYCGNIFVSFSKFQNFAIFVRIIPDDYQLFTSFVSANVGNQLKVKPNAMVADDTLMPQCATSHCACKMAAMLTHETSELSGPYLWPPDRMSLGTSAVIVLLCYFTLLHEQNLKLRFLHLL